MNSYIILPTSLVVVTAGKQYSIDNTHANYQKVVDAIKTGEWDGIPTLIDIGKHINATGQNKITVVDGVVMYGKDQMNNTLTERLLEMLREGFDITPMIALLENLTSNPTKTAIDEFYLFIETSRMPITEDGCILAYKRVDGNYYDQYTHTVVNKPVSLMNEQELATGKWFVEHANVTSQIVDGLLEVSMPAEQVDAERARACSVGLHFCSLAYLGEFYQGTGHVIIVKVNPRDIVAIPYDSNNTKGRCWKYTVIDSLVADEGNVIAGEAYNVSVVPATVVSGEHMQYDAGYKDGRQRIILSDHAAYTEFYLSGYKDGRGKQKRKFPAIKINQE